MSKAKTVKEVLKAARWIIANKGWCQGDYGKTAEGYPSDVLGDTSCVAYCSTGAIFAVEAIDYSLYNQAERLFRQLTPRQSIVAFNDAPERTKEEVLQLFDQAIEKAL